MSKTNLPFFGAKYLFYFIFIFEFSSRRFFFDVKGRYYVQYSGYNPEYSSSQYCRQGLWCSKSPRNYWRGGGIVFYKGLYILCSTLTNPHQPQSRSPHLFNILGDSAYCQRCCIETIRFDMLSWMFQKQTNLILVCCIYIYFVYIL